MAQRQTERVGNARSNWHDVEDALRQRRLVADALYRQPRLLSSLSLALPLSSSLSLALADALHCRYVCSRRTRVTSASADGLAFLMGGVARLLKRVLIRSFASVWGGRVVEREGVVTLD